MANASSPPPYFNQTVAGYLYEEPLKTLLKEFKFKQQLFLSKFLAQLIIKSIKAEPESLPECLIPIPLDNNRLKQRGFNQALEIAKIISKQLSIPIDYKSCIRIKNTLPQASLSASLRKSNIKNAFKCQKLNYTHIAIVDDIMTTGETANELAKKLKQQEIKVIELWCCAKTYTR